MNKTANISPCGKYRYMLGRIWDKNKKIVLYIGINPNTADDKIDNPTITRLIGFSKEFGYGGMIVVNLFAYRTPNPKDLLLVEDPVGPLNESALITFGITCDDVVFMWGDSPTLGRDKIAPEMFPLALCFGRSKRGNPKHPLYLKTGTPLQPFKKIT